MKLVLCILCLFVAETTAQESIAQKQSRGRQIYIQGTSQSGKDVLAYIGDTSLEVPASTIPSRLMGVNPCSVKLTVYVPGLRSSIAY